MCQDPAKEMQSLSNTPQDVPRTEAQERGRGRTVMGRRHEGQRPQDWPTVVRRWGDRNGQEDASLLRLPLGDPVP